MTETTHHSSHTFAWLVLVILALTVIAPLLQRAIDPVAQEAYLHDQARAAAQAEALDPLWLWFKRIGIGTLVVICLALALFAVNAAVHGARWFRNRSSLVYPQHGLYPGVWERPDTSRPHVPLLGQPVQYLRPPANEPKAQIMAALTNGNLDRIPVGAMRPLLRNDPGEAALPEPETDARVDLLPADAVAPDIQQKPHRIVIGETGSGKSNTLRYIIGQYARALPRAEFIICSLVRKDWPGTLQASTPDEIAGAVHAVALEIQRRDTLMTAAGITEFSDMPGLTPLVLVLDEGEAVLDAFPNRRAAAKFKAELRNVVRVGRNFGIVAVFGTQLARRDMFDATVVDNAGEVLIHRVSRVVAAQFQVWNTEVTNDLLTLPSGRAYCLKRDVFTTFPLVDMPPVRQSDLYTPTLQLAADAEADGLGENDTPDSMVLDAHEGGGRTTWTAKSAIPAMSPVSSIAPGIADVAEVARAQARELGRMRRMYNFWLANGESLRAVQREFFPDQERPGGNAFYESARAVNTMLRKRGLAPRYQEGRR